MQPSDMGGLRQKDAARGWAREAQDCSAGSLYRRAFRGECDNLTALQKKQQAHDIEPDGGPPGVNSE
ncbi:hypothetical protein NWI01_31930 [Nitrobacter winogradskyi]|uniref:Uncharacterized protein n=1 Tax=Nitrobacter winogradskyi TaxID=913 RepID=A0A4Y3WGH8_NITWI|nr:hypothetical protein NWI01_31930 [Nitrobacter winogradskyi]